ncbi:MAG: response regulator [Bacteroidales bacterium]|nr:response regulator [Bacteroidales bacterium]
MPEKLTILVADDDKVFLNTAIHHLSKKHHKIFSAINGQEAIQLFDKNLPDLVLTDLRMPECDGLEVIKHIRNYSSDIPVIVVSGKGNMNDAIEALKHGAWDYLIKPIENLDVLFHTINKACEHIELLRENRQYQQNLEEQVEKRTSELKESEQKFRTLTETLPSAIFLYQNNRFIYVNQTAEKITGYSYFELMLMNFWDIAHPDYREQIRSIGLQRQKRDIGIKKYDIKIFTKARETKWMSLTSANINYKGKLAGIATAEDITDRKRMEDEIRLNQKNLDVRKRIAETFVISPENEVFDNVLNIILDSFKSKFGYFGYISGGDLVVASMTNNIMDKSLSRRSGVRVPREEWKGLWGESLNAKKTMVRNEALQDQNGDMKMDNAMSAVILVKGTLLGQIVLADKEEGFTQEDVKSINELCDFMSPLLVDTLRQKEYLNNLLIAKNKAEESDRLKTTFLNNISHEIRTPANSIMGFAELLRDENISQVEQQNHIKNINISGQRMLDTINLIIDISRIESGEENIKPSNININKLLDAVYGEFEQNAKDKGLKLITAKPHKDDEAQVKTDEEKLMQVLTILLKNALKFTKKGTIELGYEKKEGAFEFFVKDTGVGIPSQKQKYIFERFVQADNKNTRSYQGVGLGLAIAKAYVKILGGRIWVESEKGQGSTFYVTIPYADNLNLQQKNE